MKYCTKCKQIKALTEFTKRSASSDGFAYRCKVCTSASSKKWLKNNPGKRNGNKKGSKSPASSTIADDHSRDLVGEKIEDIRAEQEILATYDDGEEPSTEPLSHDSTDTACNGEVLYIQRPLVLKIYL